MAEAPLLLAIDTATRFAGLALYDGDIVRSETYWLSNRNHSVELMPALVLLPEGGLFDRLVNALEEAQADAPLSGDEDVLLKRLRQLKDNLDGMNWNEEAAWARVHRQIGHLNDIGPQSIPVGDGTGPTKH